MDVPVELRFLVNRFDYVWNELDLNPTTTEDDRETIRDLILATMTPAEQAAARDEADAYSLALYPHAPTFYREHAEAGDPDQRDSTTWCCRAHGEADPRVGRELSGKPNESVLGKGRRYRNAVH